jgi:hypothetical protein
MAIRGHLKQYKTGPQEKPALLNIIIAKLIDLISWCVTGAPQIHLW